MGIDASRLPPPGYFAEKPLYPSIVRLFRELGASDRTVLLTELAIRQFVAAASTFEGGVERYVEEQSRVHKLRVSTVETHTLRTRVSQAYLLQTHHATDALLREFIREVRHYKMLEHWDYQANGVNIDRLAQLARHQLSERPRIKDIPEFQIVNYYRLARNAVVHDTPEEEDSLALVRGQLLDRWAEYIVTTYGRVEGCPHLSKDMAIDDFFLLTRSVKNFAYLLNDAYPLDVEDIVRVASEDPDLRKRIAECSGETHRMDNIFSEYYRHNHGRYDDEPTTRFVTEFVRQMRAKRWRQPTNLDAKRKPKR